MSRSLCVRRPKKAGPPCRLNLSVSPEIVAAREDFFNHGWTRINTDEDRLSLIRVHPCSSVVGTYWLRLGRAAPYRGFVIRRLRRASARPASPTVCRLQVGDTADWKSALGPGDAVFMAAVSMLMNRRFRRLLLAPVVLGEFAVLDLAGVHQLHSTLGASAGLVGNHVGVLSHRTSIKWRRDGYRVGLG